MVFNKMKDLKNIDWTQAIKEITELKKEIRAVHDNQAQIIPALISIYDLQKSIAFKLQVEIPEPCIDMSPEQPEPDS